MRQRGEVGEYHAGFLLCCDAMVMPRRMGEEGERRKEMGRGEQRVKSRGHAGRRIRASTSDATWQCEIQSLAC